MKPTEQSLRKMLDLTAAEIKALKKLGNGKQPTGKASRLLVANGYVVNLQNGYEITPLGREMLANIELVNAMETA